VRFEWDPEKEVRNLRKHEVSFEEASTVFGDALAATIPDAKHSELEVRFITMGMSSGQTAGRLPHRRRGERPDHQCEGGNYTGKKAL
jgi:uncharacterized DUF497 family protein